jgi:hypothetical protein
VIIEQETSTQRLRSKTPLLLGTQQEKLKITSTDISLRVDELVNLIMDHYSVRFVGA